uniref:RPA_interact_N domain-containing protein n=1 Tax=Haemonchus placei TaxID=6290 RepID=A0A0N4WVU5_HAEPC
LKAYKKNKCQKLIDVEKEVRKKRTSELFRRFGNRRHLRILLMDEKLFTAEQVVSQRNDRVSAASYPHATVILFPSWFLLESRLMASHHCGSFPKGLNRNCSPGLILTLWPASGPSRRMEPPLTGRLRCNSGARKTCSGLLSELESHGLHFDLVEDAIVAQLDSACGAINVTMRKFKKSVL